MAVDLHIHTNLSDGIYTPEEVVKQALQAALEAIAITDHDITDGILMAKNAAQGKQIEIIPGIEFSTKYEDHEIHILGYFIDPMCSELIHNLAIIHNVRKERLLSIIEKLFTLGIKLDMNEVINIAGNAPICRPHVAQAMINAGIVKTKREAFEKYLGFGKPAYSPLAALTPVDAVKLILAAKGVPVLAHPGVGNNSTILINELLIAGIKGIEVHHPEHSLKQIKLYTKIAKKNNLIITGGSDFHGSINEYSLPIGSFSVSYEVVDDLKKLSTNA